MVFRSEKNKLTKVNTLGVKLIGQCYWPIKNRYLVSDVNFSMAAK